MTSPVDNLVPLTGDPLIDGLIQGSSWQFGNDNHTLTYSLSINDSANGGGWNPQLTNAMSQAFAAWSSVANISFVQADSGMVYNQSTADIAVVLTGNELETASGAGVAGLGVFPSPSFSDTFLASLGATRSDYPNPEGDIALDNYSGVFSYLNSGGVGFTVMMHEIGHALGLKHTEDDGANGRPTFAALGISNMDSNLYTVMSYTDAMGQPLGTYLSSGNAATPMPLDILAIQQIYGANTSYHSGDDTYQLWNDGAVRTTWDAGGNDTIDASGLSNTMLIDLRPGDFSSVGGVTQVAIAYNVTIENAVGGSGNDVLIGNGANNRLDGGLGADTMSGGTGDDTYVVDSGSDVVTELSGQSNDTALSSVSYALPANVENLALTGSASITGQGNELNNSLTGNSGNSTLIGGGGDDVLIDRTGSASMQGGIGNDSYYVSTLVVISGTGWDYIGQAGDYISLGQTVSLQANKPQWTVLMHDQTHDGLIDNLTLWGNDISGNHWFSFSVTTDQIGQNLVPGSYADVMRANVGIVGHAGLDFSTDGRGSNQVFGSFVINDIAVDYSGGTPHLIRFSATFEQHSESPTAPALTGNITYGEPDTTVKSTIIELPGQGNDQAFSSVSYALPANVEDLTLNGLGDISGTGNILANVLSGNIGNNLLIGGEGNDSLSGGGGNDTIGGGSGADWLQGDSGTDTLMLTPDGVWSGAFVGFNEGSPLTSGTGQKVSLAGMNRFSDVVDGGNEADILQLTDGNDAYFLHDAFSGFTAGVTLATDVRGQASAARGLSIEQILAGAGNDLIDLTSANYSIAGVIVDGGTGNDILWGNAGNDTLLGGEGNDTLFGGAGNDFLTGGASADVFQFVKSGGGADQITGFDTAEDKLAFYGMTSLAELQSHVSGSDLILNWNDQTFTLQGVTSAPSADWILLA